jgi:EAL domain-containing protein (putative c-di-GMP-specific phosphodiesterase class I)
MLSEWARLAAEVRGPVISFNLSGQQLNDDRHMAGLLAVPEEAAQFLAVEIHQLQFCMDEAHKVPWWPWEAVPDLDAKLADLKSLGFAVWVDDFGEGSSDERTISHALVDVVKLDRSQLEADAEALARLVGRIHEQGKLALIEAVEVEAQCASIEAAGVDLAQGFLFAPPLEAEAFTDCVAAKD